MNNFRHLRSRWGLPFVIFAFSAFVFVVVAGPRATQPSPNNHFVHLAESWLHGQLHVLGDRPPGYNDWACYDSVLHDGCPPSAFQRPRESYRWYVSFPPLPAAVLLPAVAAFGTNFSDPLFWAIFAGLAPAFLFALLRRLSETKVTDRSRWDNLRLTVLFAFGSVYFFSAVQGSVWFSAHIVASLLLVLYFWWGIGARRPFWAGLMLGLCFLTRPSTSPLAIFFLLEAIRTAREMTPESSKSEEASATRRLMIYLRPVRWGEVSRKVLMFSVPILVIGAIAMSLNQARFEDPFEFGHRFLQIVWRDRIETWGLFSYHYFSKNLAIFLASLPWLQAAAPYVIVSRHGLALWVTSPNLWAVLWPKRVTPLMCSLALGAALVAILDLCYQNSGWVQFGYRFSLDYMPALILLLALGRRRFGMGFSVLLVLAILINTFGAITFDRVGQYYDNDRTQTRVFQPD